MTKEEYAEHKLKKVSSEIKRGVREYCEVTMKLSTEKCL